MGEDVKLRIMEAAKHLFAKQGFAATSVRQICEEAGANVALVSYHFGGKEKLFQAIFENSFPKAEEFSQFDLIEDPVLHMQFFVERFVTHMANNRVFGQIILHEVLLQTERIDMLRGFLMPVWKQVRDTLEKGKAMGLFSFDSLDLTLLQVMGTLIYPVHTQFVSPLLVEGRVTLEREIAERTRYILQGLGAQARESREDNR